MPRHHKTLVLVGKPSDGLHDHRLIKSFLAVEMVTDRGHVGAGALADSPKVRSVKASLGEQLTGDLEDAGGGWRWAPRWAGWPICFFALLDSHTKPTYADVVPTPFEMRKALGYRC